MELQYFDTGLYVGELPDDMGKLGAFFSVVN